MNRYMVPLGIFIILVIFLGIGLSLDPRYVPSPLINKPAPAFTLPQLNDPQTMVSPTDFKGKVWLLNVWASWCTACRQEHPLLMALAGTGEVDILGLNYKDKADDAKPWLRQLGDPYTVIAADTDGRVGIDWGVYGVPETFVIDKQGIIRLKHVGPLTADKLQQNILPLVRKLKSEPE
ncbi:MAG TPA: DsbE family thiol:disulfide interchange protein [Acidiferrobacteraceae bacterium]|nr:DsbE family thiol:disulfide interchange protein [Acidiferrobacteraceae bacterium]